MKFFWLLLGSVLLVTCSTFKEVPVEYDYSYKGNFKKYRTFDMIKPTFASDCTMYNSVVERYIAARMKFLGYRQTSNKPNLLISYKMFSDSMKLQGYHQPELETWLKSHVETDYRPVKYAMRTGTLLIQFYDRRQNRSVWQGYATASFGNIDYNSKTDLRNAVISILDKYRVWAEGFLENREPTEAINNP